MKHFYQIVFQQDHEATEALRVLDEHGKDAAIDYLAQWDNGDSESRLKSSAGSSDRTYQRGDYLLTYNLYLGYIGLERVE